MTKPDDIPQDVWETAQSSIAEGMRSTNIPEAVSRAILAERERCAKVAERDADWSKFGERDVSQWEDGPDGARDYRLGIAAGRSIAAAIRSHS
ncbi:hypothetical protein [Paradevosia shaoguanensis]|uniref:hypothetical protein n=1 Tax=Paradevosia shaoguanensis TaxID=1335043 RepID=UPI001931E18F|nr:hypothetical protein [Paradevosia shaoguanensis]